MTYSADTMESTEATRLAKQHEYISKGLGFDLHPTIEKDLANREDVKIASLSYHCRSLDGNGEISTKLRYRRPVHLEFKDIMSHDDVPNEHQGQFDIVIVQALHASILTEAWDATVKNLIALLRPGGWLQWTDWDPLTPRIAAINPAASDIALRDVLARYVDCLKWKKLGTTYRISNSMRSLGLEEDDSDMYPLNPEVEFTRNILTGVIDFLQQAGSLDETATEDFRTKVAEEIKIGRPLLWYDLWCHIGRKPL